MNKETIEQAAEQKYPTKPYAVGDRGVMYDEYAKQRTAFIEGAKWQADKMYSEEQVIKLCKQFTTFIQQKRPSYKKQLEWFEENKHIK